MKKLILFSLVLALTGARAMAADPVPAFAKGSRTINFEGNLDFEQNDKTFFDLSVGFGYFPLNRVMAKVYVDRTDYGTDTSSTGLGVGGYYYQPVVGPVSVFAGARTGWQNYNFDVGNTDSYYLSPRIGVETLIAPTVSLYFQYYHTWQSEDVYSNDSDKLDDQDSGLYSGLMIFF